MRTVAIVLVGLMMAPGVSAEVALSEAADGITTAHSGSLEVRFARDGDGLVLAGASIDGREVLGGPDVIWRAEMRDRSGGRRLLHGGMGPVQLRAEGERLLLNWAGLRAVGESIAVEIAVEFAPDDGELRWTIDFIGIPEGWTLYRYAFPVLSVVASEGDDCVLIEPDDWGTITPDPLANLEAASRTYPGSNPCMQFYALRDGPALTYLGFHDRSARLKHFLWSTDRPRGALRLSVEQRTRMAFGEGYAQEYPFVLRAEKGDWYDAAQIYRRWALTAPWTWRGPLSAGGKSPRDLIETPLVVMRLGPESDDMSFVADWALRMREWFGVPLMVHLYNWHRDYGTPSIDCYPDYFPAREGFREAARKMEAAGVRVMPYFNARLWRTDVPTWDEMGRRAAARDAYGRRHDEVWMKIPSAAMNPASLLWQWVIGEQMLRAVEVGCSGIYLDQIATSVSHPSYDPAHPHVPGETAAWVEGGNRLVEAVRSEGETIRPGIIIGAEGNAEPYMAGVDTFLTGNLNHERSIPLYSAVYHDYALSYGRYIMVDDLALPKAVLAKYAEQVSFGGQFGWSRASLERFLIDGDPTAECLRALAHLRHQFADLLAAGRMMRPPVLDVPNMMIRWMKWDREVEVALPQVLASAWQAADGTRGVLLINIGDEPAEVAPALASADGAQVHRFANGTVLAEAATSPLPVPGVTPLLITAPGEPAEIARPPDRPPLDRFTGQAASSLGDVLPFAVPRPITDAQAGEWPQVFACDALPGRADPAWRVGGPGAVDPPVTAANGVLTIDTLSDPASGATFLQAPHGVGWDVDPMQGFTVEVDLRVLACSDERFGCWVLAATPGTSTSAQVFPDRIVPLGADAVQADMARRVRALRLVGMPGAQSARLYLDGELIAEEMRVVSSPPHAAGLIVGAGASAGRIRAEIDEVRFDPNHARLPAQ